MTEHPSWKEQCHDQADQLTRMSDLLKELEWSGPPDSHGCERCPKCLQTQYPDGHFDCDIDRALEPYR